MKLLLNETHFPGPFRVRLMRVHCTILNPSMQLQQPGKFSFPGCCNSMLGSTTILQALHSTISGGTASNHHAFLVFLKDFTSAGWNLHCSLFFYLKLSFFFFIPFSYWSPVMPALVDLRNVYHSLTDGCLFWPGANYFKHLASKQTCWCNSKIFRLVVAVFRIVRSLVLGQCWSCMKLGTHIFK